jgi:hypothetical protein
MEGEVVIVLNSDDVMGARGERGGDGAGARTDFDDGARGEIADGGDDAVDGLGVVEEVLTEFGLGGHALSRW